MEKNVEVLRKMNKSLLAQQGSLRGIIVRKTWPKKRILEAICNADGSTLPRTERITSIPDLYYLPLVQLKEQCKMRGIPVTRRKKLVLIHEIIKADGNQIPDTPPPNPNKAKKVKKVKSKKAKVVKMR